jgi:hypothetical protein
MAKTWILQPNLHPSSDAYLDFIFSRPYLRIKRNVPGSQARRCVSNRCLESKSHSFAGREGTDRGGKDQFEENSKSDDKNSFYYAEENKLKQDLTTMIVSSGLADAGASAVLVHLPRCEPYGADSLHRMASRFNSRRPAAIILAQAAIGSR